MGIFEDLGAVEVKAEMQKAGFGEVVKTVEKLHDYDESKLRYVAEHVYGTSMGRTAGPASDAVIAKRVELLAEASEARRLPVDERWEGEAHDNFVKYMRKLELDLATEERNLRKFGDALVTLADHFKKVKDDTAELISWGDAALVAIDVVQNFKNATFGPLLIAGLAHQIWTTGHGIEMSHQSNLAAIAQATVSLDKLEHGEELMPTYSMTAFLSTLPTQIWEPKTKDPES